MNDPLILLQDLIAQIELEDRWQTTPETAENLKEYLDRYEGSSLDLTLLADRLSFIADTVKDAHKELAYEEALLMGHDSKFTHRGNDITPVESYIRYDYPDDEYISRVEEDLKPVKKQIKSLKSKEKGLKDSIKSRQKQLVEEGLAKKTGSTKFIKISKR